MANKILEVYKTQIDFWSKFIFSKKTIAISWVKYKLYDTVPMWMSHFGLLKVSFLFTKNAIITAKHSANGK